VLDHTPLRCHVEIDENVAAEDYVHAFHEQHASVVLQIKAREIDQGLERRIDLKPFILRREIFLL
jgi:hypothetical protein